MSSFRHPVGPQPPQVYWRRRAIVIGVLLLLVLVVVLIVARPGSGDEGGDAAAGPTPEVTPTSEPAAPLATAPAADATEQPAATDTGDAQACAPGQIAVTPVTDKTNYAATELPQISMSIQNTGRADCAVDLGSAVQKLTVTSGEDTYWTSTDCQVNGTNQMVVVAAGETLTTPPITWNRNRSSPESCASESFDPVPSGGASYFLSVSVGVVQSAEPEQMILN